jgi:hypothetical protein
MPAFFRCTDLSERMVSRRFTIQVCIPKVCDFSFVDPAALFILMRDVLTDIKLSCANRKFLSDVVEDV